MDPGSWQQAPGPVTKSMVLRDLAGFRLGGVWGGKTATEAGNSANGEERRAGRAVGGVWQQERQRAEEGIAGSPLFLRTLYVQGPL